MRNITLSAQDELIDKARAVAEQQHRSLNDLFRDWLVHLTSTQNSSETTEQRLDRIFRHAGEFRLSRHYTREEMNER